MVDSLRLCFGSCQKYEAGHYAAHRLMARFPRMDPADPGSGADVFTVDTWEGYPATRERILRHWRDARIANPVILSGDIHAFAAADLRDPDRPDAVPIASEFVGGSITSLNPDPLFRRNVARAAGFHFGDNDVRGYASATITPQTCEVRFIGLDDAKDPNSAARTLARFAVQAGRPGIVV